MIIWVKFVAGLMGRQMIRGEVVDVVYGSVVETLFIHAI